MKYLLPCPKCSRKMPVELGWAGQTVTCPCGQALEVPSVRHLRQLESAEEESLPPLWTKRHGLVFLGSAITLAAVVFGGYIFFSLPAVIDEKAIRAEVAALSPAESYVRISLGDPTLPDAVMRQMLGNPPSTLLVSKNAIMQFQASPQFLARDETLNMHQRIQVRQRLGQWLPLAVVAAVIGFVIALSALLIRPARRRTETARAERPAKKVAPGRTS